MLGQPPCQRSDWLDRGGQACLQRAAYPTSVRGNLDGWLTMQAAIVFLPNRRPSASPLVPLTSLPGLMHTTLPSTPPLPAAPACCPAAAAQSVSMGEASGPALASGAPATAAACAAGTARVVAGSGTSLAKGWRSEGSTSRSGVQGSSSAGLLAESRGSEAGGGNMGM